MYRHFGQEYWTWSAHGSWSNSAQRLKVDTNAHRPGAGERGLDSLPSPRLALYLEKAQRLMYHCVSILSYLVLACLAVGAQAQERLAPEPPPGRSGLPSLPTLEDQPSKPPVNPILPPLPLPAPEERKRLPQQVRVFVRQIRIEGNTVFPMEMLEEITKRYIGRELTTEDLEALRLEITRLYINAGYINSGAIIPDQTVSDGVITYQIIEGQLTDIEVSGTRWFRESYIRQRLALGAGPPLNMLALQERLQFLQQDERIVRLDAELRPGTQRGEGTLSVHVEEANPFKAELAFNNYQSPTVGAVRELITLTHQNLTGHGDPLSVTYGHSSGIHVQIDASYIVPLTVYDTTLGVRYRRNIFTVVQEQFQGLDVESRSEAYSVTLRQPLIRTLRREFALALSLERQEEETSLLGDPFSFSLGTPQNGRSVVTAVRLTFEWIDRTPTQVFAARARFSLGLDAFNATLNSDGLPDSRFVAWLGQVQWARQLTPWGLQVIARSDVQLASQPLLPLEQIAVGGRYTVRGYLENQVVRDNAVLASVETRIPLVRNLPWADSVQLAPFFDYGGAWNTKFRTLAPRNLLSVGLGLRWAVTLTSPVPLRPEFEIYWGIPLNHVATEGGGLQDVGVHLQFAVAAF